MTETLKKPADGDVLRAEARLTLRKAHVQEQAPSRGTLGRADAVGWQSPSSLPPGRIGHEEDAEFVVRGELGRGGMSVVQVAEQRILQRDIALKRVLSRTPDAEALLLREAIITGGLEHPNIVPIHAIVADADGPAVVMKRISGSPWEGLLLRGTATLERNLEIFVQVCNAVAFAHSREILHLDIKPANVMIGGFGEVYLVDWGLARRVEEPAVHGLVGTPSYMAPEMTRGEASTASDIFLLGSTLYEVLTGWPLYDAPDALNAVAMAMECASPEFPDDVPEELADLCRSALARDPQARFADVVTFRDAVIRYRDHRAASALCDTAEGRIQQLIGLTREPAPEDYADAQKLFGEARFAYEQATRIWPEADEVQQGLWRALRVMIEYELALHHPDAAASLLSSFEDPPADLLRQVQEAEAQARHAERRLADLERDADPEVGAAGRVRAFLVFTVTVLVMTSALGISRALRPGYSPTSMRLLYVGGFVLAALAVIAYFWRRSGWNLVNRRIGLISLATLGASFLNRLAGVAGGVPAPQVLVCDAFLLGLGGLALSLFHTGGRWLAALSFTVAFAGVLYPMWVDDMFIGLSITIPLGVLFFRATPPSDTR